MIKKKYQGIEVPALGLGAMRLPLIAKTDTIDEDKVTEMVAYAMEKGVNYFDTAYGYHGGQSELVMGKVLKKYPRESFYLASKFPGYDLKNIPHVEEIFEEQLKKCQVDYFDFYLFHNVCENNIDEYLDPQYHILDYLLEQKRKGRIRHLGFSCHGEMPILKRFLEAYGQYMEFCQLQINWLDWTFQKAKEKVEVVDSYKIPVWVMEPVRGGKLLTLHEPYASQIKSIRNDDLVTSCFRFIQSLPTVAVTLSGMSNMEQLKENIRIFEKDLPWNEDERKKAEGIAEDILKNKILPCTGCRYCIEKCPKGLDIPRLLNLYNEHSYSGGGFLAPMALQKMAKEKWPNACIGCHSCEKVCPQRIEIANAMKQFTLMLKQ